MNKPISLGILLFGLGFCIQSIATAIAIPNTASISMGSNPIDTFYGYDNGIVTLTLNPSYDFILTTAFSDNYGCIVKVNGVNTNRTASAYNIYYYNAGSNTNTAFTQGNGSLKVPAGSTVTVNACGNYHFSGYYAQP